MFCSYCALSSLSSLFYSLFPSYSTWCLSLERDSVPASYSCWDSFLQHPFCLYLSSLKPYLCWCLSSYRKTLNVCLYSCFSTCSYWNEHYKGFPVRWQHVTCKFVIRQIWRKAPGTIVRLSLPCTDIMHNRVHTRLLCVIATVIQFDNYSPHKENDKGLTWPEQPLAIGG